MKRISIFTIITSLALLSSCGSGTVPEGAIDVNAPGEPFDHYWSRCVGAGRANEGLRASWLEHLKTVQENCGFQYVRFHGLFHDDMFVYREANQRGDYREGLEVFNWQYIDELFDRMLDVNVKPFLELGFFPKDIAAPGSKTQMWWKGNITPPEDFGKWAKLITKFTEHILSRYGAEEVRTWYFEVWNEPNIKGFWDSDQATYFELYRTTVLAIKEVDNELKVGGPATSSFRRMMGEGGKPYYVGTWVDDFINYCEKEGLPVDFISCHPYPHEWAFDAEQENLNARDIRLMTSTIDDMRWVRNRVDNSPFQGAEIHLTEWNSSASSRDHSHDRLPAASFLLKILPQGIGLANSLSYWTFTDVFEEKGAGNSVFHGGFGMINYQGLPKPTFHAYRMLNALGDEVINRDGDAFVTRHSDTGKITAILTHYPEEMNGKGIPVSNFEDEESAQRACEIGSPKAFSLVLSGLKPGAVFDIEILDREHGDVYEAWQRIGAPEPPSRQQIVELKEKACATLRTTVKADRAGVLSWRETLLPWSCVLINER